MFSRIHTGTIRVLYGNQSLYLQWNEIRANIDQKKKKSDLDTFYAVNHISLSRWCDDKNRVEYFWKRNLWFNL